MFRTKFFTGWLLLALAVSSVPAMGQDGGDPINSDQPKKAYSPYVDRDYPQNVYWGESHLHTSYSWDVCLV